MDTTVPQRTTATTFSSPQVGNNRSGHILGG
jgi:hypothetical protein